MRPLSGKEYWDRRYAEPRGEDLSISGFRNRYQRKIAHLVSGLINPGASVLEIGAGNSEWLVHLARTFPSSQFFGLDYSAAGCERLHAKLLRSGVDAKVINADAFAPPVDLLGAFDVVVSFGVVEHFDDLPSVVSSFVRYLKPGGTMFTLIPNLAGLIGWLAKRLNRTVYAMHNPHDLTSLIRGHEVASLRVKDGGYLGATDFGVLSATVTTEQRSQYLAYLWLSRFSKAVMLFEEKFFDLPPGKLLSPYIYAVSRADTASTASGPSNVAAQAN